MRPFNDAQKSLNAKAARTQTLFRIETLLGKLPSVALSLVLLGLAAAIPAALLTKKEVETVTPAYLEVDVSGEPGRLASYRREAALPN
ncbi:hypothetical protein [Parvularcula maris]|uniref:Uncharacterized protein n=1 Tax=Parvularcula maris TaxID=2965077 RepID=A0A9X2RL08_9PROT|nr:hypothetical protein [Parvularcula maris]MCQ8186348.1 hypothetical protein [Parvularcula maris]